ncbi:MAG: ferrous iron transport protein B, partial [Planctomycetota bacterium]
MPGRDPSNQLTVALAGNPNSGKSTLFNNLTGARQHVGNYPGVTVEKKEGWTRHAGGRLHVVDLPGTYSLTAYTLEERVARQFILDERPDVVVDVLDASNLERHLVLAAQLMELQVPLVLVLNMSDVARGRGIRIDTDLLGDLLGVTIVETVGHRNRGTDVLKQAIIRAAHEAHRPKPVLYGDEIEGQLRKIVARIEPFEKLTAHYPTRWLAVKLLEGDTEVRELVEQHVDDTAPVDRAVEEAAEHLRRDVGDTPESLLGDARYGFATGACRETVKRTAERRRYISDHIDQVVLHPVAGIPIFLGLMYLLFKLTFTLAAPMQEAVGWGFEQLGGLVASMWAPGSESFVKSLLVEGVIAGVGGVLEFLPTIMFLFLAISLLEGTGYMARAAFIMDRVMHRLGLHGKSFIPLLLGFGCTVPAILATRTLESRRDRLTTMMILPLMSCSARIPIYGLLIPAFFPAGSQAIVLWGIYTTGVVLAVVLAKLLRSTLFKGESTPLVMELPPYRMPTVKGTFIHMWNRTRHFLVKAGTLILVASVVLWFM